MDKVRYLFKKTREKDDVLETEAEGRDADDELAARLEAGEVVSLGGKVLNSHADDAVSSC